MLPDYSIDVWSYCLMPNHVHAVIVPRNEHDMSRFLAVLHRRYARRTNLLNEWSGHLWQKRYYSVVMDEAHTYAALRYVEMNPVRSGMCASPVDWPWSSARANLELTEDPLVDRSNTRNIIGDWAAYLADPEDSKMLDKLRKQTGTGRPDGSDAFIDQLEEITGRNIRRRHAGRKKKYGIRYL